MCVNDYSITYIDITHTKKKKKKKRKEKGKKEEGGLSAGAQTPLKNLVANLKERDQGHGMHMYRAHLWSTGLARCVWKPKGGKFAVPEHTFEYAQRSVRRVKKRSEQEPNLEAAGKFLPKLPFVLYRWFNNYPRQESSDKRTLQSHLDRKCKSPPPVTTLHFPSRAW